MDQHFQWHDSYTSTIRGTDVLFQTQLEREAYDIINDRLLLGDSPEIFRTSTILGFKEDFVFDAQGIVRSYKINDIEALRTIPPMTWLLRDQQQARVRDVSNARVQATEDRLERDIVGDFLRDGLFEEEEEEGTSQPSTSSGSSRESSPSYSFTTSTNSSSTSSPSLSPVSSHPMLPYSHRYVPQNYFDDVQRASSTSNVVQEMPPPQAAPVPLTTAVSFDQFTATARAGSRSHRCSPSPSSSHSSTSELPEFVQGSSRDRSISSTSSKKRKHVSDDDSDEGYEAKPSRDQPKNKGRQRGQKKKGNSRPRKYRTRGLHCLHKECFGEDKLFNAPRDRNRHMDSHFANRFICPGCRTLICRADAVRRHANDQIEKHGDWRCWYACEGKEAKDFEALPPAWHKAKGWENMFFPERDDPLYEKAVEVLGHRG